MKTRKPVYHVSTSSLLNRPLGTLAASVSDILDVKLDLIFAELLNVFKKMVYSEMIVDQPRETGVGASARVNLPSAGRGQQGCEGRGGVLTALGGRGVPTSAGSPRWVSRDRRADASRSGFGLRCEWAQHWSGHSDGIQAPGAGGTRDPVLSGTTTLTGKSLEHCRPWECGSPS